MDWCPFYHGSRLPEVEKMPDQKSTSHPLDLQLCFAQAKSLSTLILYLLECPQDYHYFCCSLWNTSPSTNKFTTTGNSLPPLRSFESPEHAVMFLNREFEDLKEDGILDSRYASAARVDRKRKHLWGVWMYPHLWIFWSLP